MFRKNWKKEEQKLREKEIQAKVQRLTDQQHRITNKFLKDHEEDFNNKLINLAGDLQRLEQYKKNALSIFSSRFTVEVAVEQINRRFKV